MSRKRRLLIVEDEAPIRHGLVDVFVYHGYAVDAESDGREGFLRARSGRYDLVVLDVMLPGMDGFAICEALREHDREQPIIMLTARTAEEDIINGLRLGADDYVAKPFSVQALVLRVEAVLRRVHGADAGARHIALGAGDSIDCANLTGTVAGHAVSFTRRETEMLQYLDRHADRAVTRDELLHEVWGYARHALLETRTVDIHIAKLRRKIEHDPAQPARLVTVRGAGYRLLRAD